MLLSHGSVLPSLSRKIRTLYSVPWEERVSAAQNILAALVNTVQGLDKWERSLQATTSGPLVWPTKAVRPTLRRTSNEVEMDSSFLWFPSLPVATSLTHLWAFRAVCFSQLAQLLSLDLISSAELERIRTCLDVSGVEDCQEQTVVFHSMIYQSLQYFMQDEMRFYGTESVTLPLRVAQMVSFLFPLRT